MSEQPTTVTSIRPGLHVTGLDRGQIPTADWLCSCGHHERARGEEGVRQLCAEVRVGHCPHTTTAKEAA
ncbi:hypothetical protein [Streptomyces sp. bgisy154]|uniref:hypothetical protein n=1 Tax=Streptomyces sp. bgisy154 TaxID=3413794 RepID=UPI003D736A1C